MKTIPLRGWVLFAWIAPFVACSGGDSTINSTSLNVVVPDGMDDETDIQQVQYAISCEGNDDSFLDTNQSFSDEVVITGDLEVVDDRTSGEPPSPTEVWQGFMDLPPGPCVVQLSALDEGGERICVVDHAFYVAADTSTKVDLILLCDISFQRPVGMLDIDGTFSFVVGNFCPDLFVLNALGTVSPEGTIEVQVRGRDGDGSCNQSCDPQTCDDSVPSVCTPGPDPGVSITLTTDNGEFDCDQDGFTDGMSCVLLGDQLTTGDVGFAFGPSDAGEVATIVATITDGDVDCDKSKQIEIAAPPDIEDPCDTPDVCDDGNDCTKDLCTNNYGVAHCSNPPKPAWTNCVLPSGAPGECDGAGTCFCPVCTSDLDCGSATQCISQPICNVAACQCEPGVPLEAGTPCLFEGVDPGACDGAGYCHCI